MERVEEQLRRLKENGDFAVFAAFLRTPAARRYIGERVNTDYTRALDDLDHRAREFRPESFTDLQARTRGPLRAVIEFVAKELRKKRIDSLVNAMSAMNREPAVPSLTAIDRNLTELCEAWKLPLPIPPEHSELNGVSPSALEAYRRCPFTFYLTRQFGDKPVKNGLAALEHWEFGNLAHDALDVWAKGEAVNSSDPQAIREALFAAVDRLVAERFGACPQRNGGACPQPTQPAIGACPQRNGGACPQAVAGQIMDMKARFTNFAELQAARHLAGWRVVTTELKLEFMLDGTRVYGRCDRVDFNERTGEWCVLDYKTWDKPPVKLESLQLPLYAAMIDACKEPKVAEAHLGAITHAHVILGKHREDVVFTPAVGADSIRRELESAREQLQRLRRGIFWPPSPKGEWRRAFGEWMFAGDPAQSVAAAWLRDQQRRLAEGQG